MAGSVTMEIELDETEAHEAVLEVVPRSVRSAHRTDPEALTALKGCLAVGGPWTRAVSPDEEDDSELRAFMESQSDEFDFFLLQVTCTFRPLPDEPFQSAFLELRLEPAEAAAVEPMAWSMQPERLTRQRTLERKVKLGGSLKILGVGLEGGVEQTEGFSPDEVFLQALYEGLPTPSWELRTTRWARIEGLQRFAVVVRAAKRVQTLGSATVRATVRRKRFGLLSYRAAVGEGEQIQFTFP
jgi:hypothetical protein